MEMSEAEKSRELSQSAKHTFHNKEIEILKLTSPLQNDRPK